MSDDQERRTVSQPEAPKIEFPCANYPIKVVGKGKEDYDRVIFDIIAVHAPDCDFARLTARDSKNGRFRAITVYITATGIDQLPQIHSDLSAHDYVHMVS